MRFLVSIILLLSLTSCQAMKSPSAISTSAGHAAGSLEAAHRSIGAAIPHTDAIGKASLTDADGSITIVLKQDIPVYEQTASEVATLQAENAKLKADFWSVRQKAYFWTIVTVIAVGLILLSIAKVYAANPFGKISYHLGLTLCTGFLYPLHIVLTWLFGKIHDGIASLLAKLTKKKTPGTVS